MCNKGQGEFVLFLDGDIVPIRNSIVAMWEYLMGTNLPGIYYDVTGDTAVESKATRAENPLIPADVEAVPVVMFHYAMFRREWLLAHPLPEFAPFDGPGWGVEEDVCYLQSPKAVFGKIMYRKFFHYAAGRSLNFLNEDLPVSRAKRWATWVMLQSVKLDVLKKVFAQRKHPYLKLNMMHVKLKAPSLINNAALSAMEEFIPLSLKPQDLKNTQIKFL